MAQIEHKIQLLLAQNNGVGVVGGSYAPGLPITLVSELALNALGYAAEDNDLNREIAEYILTGAGAAVTSARNGRQAVALFEASGQGSVPVFDAILMDIVMPEMDGLQAARAIRASAHPGAATVPIVAQSANAFADDVRKSSEAGMNGYVTKPLDETRLLRELAQYKNSLQHLWLASRSGRLFYFLICAASKKSEKLPLYSRPLVYSAQL